MDPQQDNETGGGAFTAGISCATAVRILGILYVISFLIHFQKLALEKEWYFKTYDYMPQWLATLRYCFSWFQRIVGMGGALGLIMLRNWGRWIIISLSVFTATTVYWKHPYKAMLRHAQGLDQQYGSFFTNDSGISFASLTPVSVAAHCLFNIALCAAVIYFLTRPRIKAVFR